MFDKTEEIWKWICCISIVAMIFAFGWLKYSEGKMIESRNAYDEAKEAYERSEAKFDALLLIYQELEKE